MADRACFSHRYHGLQLGAHPGRGSNLPHDRRLDPWVYEASIRGLVHGDDPLGFPEYVRGNRGHHHAGHARVATHHAGFRRRPIRFRVVLVYHCEVGFSTTPLGKSAFIASSIARVTLEEVVFKALPFNFVNILIITLLFVIPELLTWLPDKLG